MRYALLLLLLIRAVDAFSLSIYGGDDRRDTYAETSKDLLTWARASAALVDRENMTAVGNNFKLSGTKLEEFQDFCDGTRFKTQTLAAQCSGTLIANDLILTSGHCYQIPAEVCKNQSWVFDYKVKNDQQSEVMISKSQVYSCKRALYRSPTAGHNPKEDFAIIQLDRRVVGRKPLKLQKEGSVQSGMGLTMIGYPLGLPQKITDNASVNVVKEFTFTTNLDSFTGNSGSAVLDSRNGEILGVLTGGAQDFEWTDTCVNLATYDPKKGRELVMKIDRVRAILTKLKR